MIKISLRRNSIYIINLIIHYNMRRVIRTIINNYFSFKDSLIFTVLMVLGEFFGGLSVYIYQHLFLNKHKNKNKNKLNDIGNIKTLIKEDKMNRVDGNFKIFLLIFFSAFFDFIEYVFLNYFVPKLADVSPSAELRLHSISTISSCIVFIYTLKLKIGKHELYSMIIIGICLILVSITEFIFQSTVALFGELFLSYLLTYISIIIISFTDLIEKYLNQFNFLDPMLILVFESIFGIILISIYSALIKDPFNSIIKLFEELETGKIILFIFLLFLYFALCAGVNVYKILCTVIYSPMYKSIAYYILNPVMIIP